MDICDLSVSAMKTKNCKPTNSHVVSECILYDCKADPGHMLSSIPALNTVDTTLSKLVGFLQP